MLVFAIIAVFVAGLMIGRTPEYLGKKIEPKDVKMASFVILILAFSILGFSAWASVSKMGLPDPVTNQLTDGTNNSGPLLTLDGSYSAQFEHTVVVTKTGCEILTQL
jgi:K+-transporting ATPase ATPase A chain